MKDDDRDVEDGVRGEDKEKMSRTERMMKVKAQDDKRADERERENTDTEEQAEEKAGGAARRTVNANKGACRRVEGARIHDRLMDVDSDDAKSERERDMVQAQGVAETRGIDEGTEDEYSLRRQQGKTSKKVAIIQVIV